MCKEESEIDHVNTRGKEEIGSILGFMEDGEGKIIGEHEFHITEFAFHFTEFELG